MAPQRSKALEVDVLIVKGKQKVTYWPVKLL